MSVGSRKQWESQVETIYMIRPTHLNSAGRLFGGILMQWIDEAAGLVAIRHSRRNVTTASVDNLQFLKGAYQGETIIIRAKLTYVGRTSMEVEVKTFKEDINRNSELINQAYFTMVALDENDRPTPVPRLDLQSEEQKAEWKRAEIRRKMRMKLVEELEESKIKKVTNTLTFSGKNQ